MCAVLALHWRCVVGGGSDRNAHSQSPISPTLIVEIFSCLCFAAVLTRSMAVFISPVAFHARKGISGEGLWDPVTCSSGPSLLSIYKPHTLSSGNSATRAHDPRECREGVYNVCGGGFSFFLWTGRICCPDRRHRMDHYLKALL